MKNWIRRYATLAIATVCICLFWSAMAHDLARAEESTVTISGTITAISYGAWNPFGGRKATLVIQDAKRNQHTVYVGRRTAYIPHRTPDVNDKVTVVCIRKEGYLAGLTVSYK